MRPIAPRIPDGEEVTFAEDQEEYRTITAAVRPNALYPGATEIVTRWTMTAEERQRIFRGEDLYVTQVSFTGKMTPINVTLGEVD